VEGRLVENTVSHKKFPRPWAWKLITEKRRITKRAEEAIIGFGADDTSLVLMGVYPL
jgi:hypothetical protein